MSLKGFNAEENLKVEFSGDGYASRRIRSARAEACSRMSHRRPLRHDDFGTNAPGLDGLGRRRLVIPGSINAATIGGKDGRK